MKIKDIKVGMTFISKYGEHRTIVVSGFSQSISRPFGTIKTWINFTEKGNQYGLQMDIGGINSNWRLVK